MKRKGLILTFTIAILLVGTSLSTLNYTTSHVDRPQQANLSDIDAESTINVQCGNRIYGADLDSLLGDAVTFLLFENDMNNGFYANVELVNGTTEFDLAVNGSNEGDQLNTFVESNSELRINGVDSETTLDADDYVEYKIEAKITGPTQTNVTIRRVTLENTGVLFSSECPYSDQNE